MLLYNLKVVKKVSIGKQIQKYRKASGLTQKELAKKSGISEIAIRQYELEKRIPKADMLKSIATSLKISPSLLMGIDVSSFESKIDIDKTHQELEESEIIKYYFKILGFTIKENVSKWHLENDSNENQIVIVDEIEYLLSKDNNSVTISLKEFQEIQSRNRDVIEGIFYKKLMQNINKNTRM